jgi:hypothetical protein
MCLCPLHLFSKLCFLEGKNSRVDSGEAAECLLPELPKLDSTGNGEPLSAVEQEGALLSSSGFKAYLEIEIEIECSLHRHHLKTPPFP